MRRTTFTLVIAGILISVSFLVRCGLNDITRSGGNEGIRSERKPADRSASVLRDPPAARIAKKQARSFPAEQGNEGKKLFAIQPGPIESSFVQQILSDSAPGARTMFRGGLEALNQGDFSKARLIFQELLSEYGCDCRENRLAAPAYWSIGLSYYQEGGDAGLSSSGTFFQSFLQTYSNCDADELAHAAQINIAVIYMERMRLSAKEPARERAARSAAEALKAFLQKWPDSPQASAANVYLGDLETYLARQR